jgi:LmbE family N-acetylglucosaminyl deacetylase
VGPVQGSRGVLVVVAHPDDEVLGCGGTVATLASQGTAVTSCILSASAGARTNRPEVAALTEQTLAAQTELGLRPPVLGDFPNMQLNAVPHLELVQFIEEAIIATGAEFIFTHHPSDLNDDHLQVSRACRSAARIYQRRSLDVRLRGLYLMEILSSTDWAFPSSEEVFSPTGYFEIGEDGLEKKISALGCYEGVMRPFPHPRSTEVVRALATYRGGQSGMRFAESFQIAFQDISVG